MIESERAEEGREREERQREIEGEKERASGRNATVSVLLRISFPWIAANRTSSKLAVLRAAAALSDFDIEINIPRELPAACAPARYTRENASRDTVGSAIRGKTWSSTAEK